MNKEQLQGRIQAVKGKAKEVAGNILEDKVMEVEGNIEKNVGKTKAGFGDLKEDIKKIP